MQINHLQQPILPIAVDKALRAALPTVSDGVTVWQGGMSAILLDSATAGDQALAATVLESHNTLDVTTDKATITADGADTATITCSDAALGADVSVDYTVWLDDVVYDSGTDTLATGTATLTLATITAGTYLIEIRRQSGNYASGYVTVRAD